MKMGPQSVSLLLGQGPARWDFSLKIRFGHKIRLNWGNPADFGIGYAIWRAALNIFLM